MRRWPKGPRRQDREARPDPDEGVGACRPDRVLLAVRYWRGVGVGLVWRWRKALGVPRFNEGTARLWRELTPARLGDHCGPVPGRRLRMKLSPKRARELKRRALAGESRTAL